ncbi:MAG: alpha/beta fold hydrolase [Burkholderiales bacterium]|nr:alpha/beta fold hydrolase [Burkholderiales bacterium]
MIDLVLVCGLNNTPDIWDEVCAELERMLPGQLNIHRPFMPAQDSTEAIAQTLLETLPPRFSYVGFSFGGYVGMALLEAAPPRVERFALVCSNSTGEPESARPMRQRAIEIAQAGGHAGLIAKVYPNTVHPSRIDDQAIIARREKMVPEYGAQRFIAHTQACMKRPDRTHLLGAFSGPALLVATSHDKVVLPEAIRRTADAAPNARFELIEDSGHLLPLEQPQALAASIARWLAQPAAA